ncbi:hypothetical protein BC792_105146 [Sphingobacterium allocomposti]|uniref:Histidine kinase n=1 Tax=Sphingobacterium allocomposti TaxID=415956 RepID=A0A5S5DLQ9_9SPHI|nr:hypothetical protein [Sphingobacterium composti Yoo et al. 2007 non Ten et al. 2007]TYP96655.1 hypothetical protein BC792_105146 [Sphingobacterium composti Yoo et al. 2007 non Ten et al. 2007]
MTAFLDKIFGSKIEVDMAKAGLEAELSFLEARMDTHLAKRVLEGGDSPDILTKYTAFLKEMLALDMHTVISIGKELDLLAAYLDLYQGSEKQDLFIRFDPAVDCTKMVPPLVIFPLVGNALQYGYNSMERYPLKIKVRAFEKMLTVEVSNRINHYVASQGETLIIHRYRNRLLSLFPDRHTLFSNSNSNTFKATLQIRW